MKQVRLVLIMGGGVSLGTYVAGTLAEIFWALKSVTPTGGQAPIRIDVITGASAGAMSAALMAKGLTGDPGAIRDLHDAWVEDIDIKKLCPTPATSFDPLSLLSGGAVEEIAKKRLTPPSDYSQWQPFCAPTLRIGFTLTNLGGVVYRIRYANKDDMFFTTRIHSDYQRVMLEQNCETGNGKLAQTWEQIERAAVASGAFPGAFPPRKLDRKRTEYSGAVLPPEVNALDMWYADGGVLDNEPVGLAKSLVDEDASHDERDYRYILIDPYLDAPASSNLYPGPPTLPAVLGVLAKAVFTQSAAKDWIRANKVNWRISVLDNFAEKHLRPLLDGVQHSPDAAAIGAALIKQAHDIAEYKVAVNEQNEASEQRITQYLNGNYQRITTDPRYVEALDGLAGGALNAMKAAIFVIENVAGLRNKDAMDLYLIAPQGHGEHPLAGDFLHNFGGFFRREWREHDYLCGRRDARRALQTEVAMSPGAGVLSSYAPEPGIDYDPPEIEAGPETLTDAEKKSFQDYFQQRFSDMLAPHLPWYVRPSKALIGGAAAKLAMKGMGL